MAKKDMHSFKRYQKELKRKEKAGEKLSRRQGKKEQDAKEFDESGHPEEKADNI